VTRTGGGFYFDTKHLARDVINKSKKVYKVTESVEKFIEQNSLGGFSACLVYYVAASLSSGREACAKASVLWTSYKMKNFIQNFKSEDIKLEWMKELEKNLDIENYFLFDLKEINTIMISDNAAQHVVKVYQEKVRQGKKREEVIDEFKNTKSKGDTTPGVINLSFIYLDPSFSFSRTYLHLTFTTNPSSKNFLSQEVDLKPDTLLWEISQNHSLQAVFDATKFKQVNEENMISAIDLFKQKQLDEKFKNVASNKLLWQMVEEVADVARSQAGSFNFKNKSLDQFVLELKEGLDFRTLINYLDFYESVDSLDFLNSQIKLHLFFGVMFYNIAEANCTSKIGYYLESLTKTIEKFIENKNLDLEGALLTYAIVQSVIIGKSDEKLGEYLTYFMSSYNIKSYIQHFAKTYSDIKPEDLKTNILQKCIKLVENFVVTSENFKMFQNILAVAVNNEEVLVIIGDFEPLKNKNMSFENIDVVTKMFAQYNKFAQIRFVKNLKEEYKYNNIARLEEGSFFDKMLTNKNCLKDFNKAEFKVDVFQKYKERSEQFEKSLFYPQGLSSSYYEEEKKCSDYAQNFDELMQKIGSTSHIYEDSDSY
jgi:hypothetical protein